MSLATDSKHLSLQPHVSEKTYALSETGVYVFTVSRDAAKTAIKEAVEAQFKVSVVAVRSHVVKGKTKRSVKRRVQPIDGKRAAVKRAFVTLKEGDSIPIFEEAA